MLAFTAGKVIQGVKRGMPIYEYRCMGCRHQFQSLVMGAKEEKALKCPECHGEKLKKLISRAAYHTSEKDRLEAFDPASMKADAFYRDTRNIGLAAKKRAQQMGMELGDGFEAKLDKLRTDPGSVIKDSE